MYSTHHGLRLLLSQQVNQQAEVLQGLQAEVHMFGGVEAQINHVLLQGQLLEVLVTVLARVQPFHLLEALLILLILPEHHLGPLKRITKQTGLQQEVLDQVFNVSLRVL